MCLDLSLIQNIASLKSVKFILDAVFWQLSCLNCTGFLTAIGQLPLVASKNVSDSSFIRASVRNFGAMHLAPAADKKSLMN